MTDFDSFLNERDKDRLEKEAADVVVLVLDHMVYQNLD
jgi:hypothetical protein